MRIKTNTSRNLIKQMKKKQMDIISKGLLSSIKLIKVNNQNTGN